jgi:hypothetical protein
MEMLERMLNYFGSEQNGFFLADPEGYNGDSIANATAFHI